MPHLNIKGHYVQEVRGQSKHAALPSQPIALLILTKINTTATRNAKNIHQTR